MWVLRWVHACNVTAYGNAVTLQVTDMERSYDLNFHPVPNGGTVSCKCYTMGFPVCYRSQQHHECKEGERSGRWWCVTLHVQACSGRNCIIPLMRWPNTDSAPNMPLTLPRNQLLICYVVTSPVHTSGFGGLVVSMLASSTQDRGFTPDRIRRIFRAKKSSACLPSEGK
jgi:hypothetical protein